MPVTAYARALSRLDSPASPLNETNKRRLFSTTYTTANAYTLGMLAPLRLPSPVTIMMLPLNQDVTWMNGFFNGASSGVYRREDGVVVVVAFNSDMSTGFIAAEVASLDAALNTVPPTAWPTIDLFPVAP